MLCIYYYYYIILYAVSPSPSGDNCGSASMCTEEATCKLDDRSLRRQKDQVYSSSHSEIQRKLHECNCNSRICKQNLKLCKEQLEEDSDVSG